MKSVYEPLTWLVGGEAGYGITTMGQMFARACSRGGLNVFGYVEYPSLIRGGHNTAMVRVAKEKVYAHSDKIDVMLALNKETIDLPKNRRIIEQVLKNLFQLDMVLTTVLEGDISLESLDSATDLIDQALQMFGGKVVEE